MNNCLIIALGYKPTKSYKQIENIILNISFDRKNPRFSSCFSGNKDLMKHTYMQKYP